MLLAQSTTDSMRQANIQRYYQLAVQYKNGTGVQMDYNKAYSYFEQAARLGDAQSIYSLAYMQYKGLGCTQDYVSAAGLFAQGAYRGRDNSMYFYGLCWRNGYGTTINADSAKYWLQRADSLGYPQAALELAALAPENGNDSAKALVQQISNAAVPDKAPINKFTKVFHNQPSRETMAGQYMGWLVQYDWSGQNVAEAKRLMLTIKSDNGKFSGTWIEGTDTAEITATLNSTALKFDNTSYKRKDHYSPANAVTYDFGDAALNMVQLGDSLFLAGNISMFSPERGEPSKPLFVALAREEKQTLGQDIGLRVSPNPFVTTLNVEFTIPKGAPVEIQLLDAGGAIVYRNPAGTLSAGHYLLPLQPGYIVPGVYLVKVVYGYKTAVVKVVRE
jgi:TPR repeat protein